MIAKTVVYKDYNGNERTETLLFNLDRSELAELELTTAGGLHDTLKLITETNDTPRMVKLFKSLVIKSYGEKTPDGKAFIKSDEKAELFSHSKAYDVLFMELLSDPDKAAEFFNGVIPEELAKEVQAQLDNNNENNILQITQKPTV